MDKSFTSIHKSKGKYYGNAIAPWLPTIVMIIGIMACEATGNTGILQFALMGFIGLIIDFLLVKDKKKRDSIYFAGLQNNILSAIIMAFILAGIMSKLLSMSGLINGLIWVVSEVGLHTGLIPVLSFVTCVLISSACGTSAGSITAVAPTLIPLAFEFDCNIGLVCGAIISGAIFGDNLAPISDTTIGSALTQEAQVADVVRTRFFYSLIAGGFSAIFFLVFGLITAPNEVTIAIKASDIKSLFMLTIPILMIAIMKKGYDLVSTLIICNVVGILLSLILGCSSLSEMFSVNGPIIQGMTGMLNRVLFLFMLFILLETLNRSGAFEHLLAKFTKLCKTSRGAEFACMLIAGIGVTATGGSSTAIMFFGPMVRKISKKFNIENTRSANIIDATACSVAGLLPYGTPCILTVSFVSQYTSNQSFSFIDILPYNFHCHFLILVYIISILIRKKYK